MQKKSEDFSVEAAARLAQTPAGQQLLAILRSADPHKLQQVADQAASGDYEQASRIAKDLLSSSDAQELLKDLGR